MSGSVITAVIDDGVNEGYYMTESLNFNICITSKLSVIERKGYNPCARSHGTTCAAIIKKYAPDCMLGSIKILSGISKRGLKEQLIGALDWCIANSVRLVNMSIGTIDFRDFAEINAAVNRAYRSGVIIVAACSNKNVYTVPASCSNTIGVKADRSNSIDEGKFIYNHYSSDGVEITACSSFSLKTHDGTDKMIYPSNSYAAPLITAKVYRILQEEPGITLDEIKLKLAQMSDTDTYADIHKDTVIYRKADWIENAEIIAADGKPFKLCGINPPFAVKKDNDTGKLSSSLAVIQMSSDNGEQVPVRIQDKFDGRVWEPSIIKNFFNRNIIHREIDIPIIAVYDHTASGYIGILQKLETLFRNDGYYALGITDSPSGVLAGLEVSDYDNPAGCIRTLYSVYDCDIILFGTAKKGESGSNTEESTEDRNFSVQCIEEELDIDIKVILTEDTGEGIEIADRLYGVKRNEEKYEYRNESEGETIIVSHSENTADIKYKHIVCDKFYDGVAAEKLYLLIKSMFDEEGDME